VVEQVRSKGRNIALDFLARSLRKGLRQKCNGIVRAAIAVHEAPHPGRGFL
jgi:hypothetical protein